MKSFEEHLTSLIARKRIRPRSLENGECQSLRGSRCTLCHAVEWTYADEIRSKNDAIRAFWGERYSPDALSSIVPSPLGRNYRTVSKRRAFHAKREVMLGLISPSEDRQYKPFEVVRCAIEPVEHASIYETIQGLLKKPYAQPLAESIRYIIIKGNYTEHTLIVSAAHVDAATVRAMNTLSKSLTRSHTGIAGVFLYEDKSNGRYYLPASRQQAIRRVYGNDRIFQRICGRSFLYPPLAFSQINLSMTDHFVANAAALLDMTPQTRLIDLYCGYGLFAICLSAKVHSAIGMDVSADSIDAAIANARRNGVTNTKFLRGDITINTLPRVLRTPDDHKVVLLDPPRNGTGQGVIEYVAAAMPRQVLHIFCNINIMPAELNRWTENGFRITKVVPLDMFPGTSTIETMVLLERP